MPDVFIVLAAISVAIGALALTKISVDIVLVGTLTFLLAANVISPADALGGFANESVATIAALYIVVAGLRETGVVTWISHAILGAGRTVTATQLRLMIPVALLSAFINNTPVVAMLIPGVRDWGKRFRVSPSKLLMPLSYAAIIGGTCTLVGTSTNLVINGMMLEYTDVHLGLFDIAIIGLPCIVIVIAYTVIAGRWLLPEGEQDEVDIDSVKKYTVEMLVENGSSLATKTIEQAGLRHLPGLFLVEIQRGGTVIPAVSPQERLQEGDRLLFAGIVESVADLQRFDGLRIATDHVLKLDTQRSSHTLIEVVVSEACPLIGRSVREGQFRNVYNAAILAVSRNGQHVRERIGDIVLAPGDMLLVEAHEDFARQHRNTKDFLLVSQVENSNPPKTEKRTIAVFIFLAMIALAATGVYSLMVAALLAAGAMVVARCTSAGGARREISWQMLIVIGASIGLGNALMTSGAAELLAGALEGIAQHDAYTLLGIVFLVAASLTAVITNIAAATLMFPIVVSLAEISGVSLTAFCVTLMMAASASFATPIGYQTNLMVYGPGGYQFSDFMKMGIPLTLLVGVATVVLAEAFF